MAKSTPEQIFTKFYMLANDAAASETERGDAKRRMAAWLKRHGKTERDYPAIFAKTAADDEAQKPPPPPSDPRDNASVRFDPKRHNPASLVEGVVKQYVTMSEHARVVYSLWVPFTHVYRKFAVAPRVALTSEDPNCGKSTALELARLLAFRPNEEALGSAAALRAHLDRGPGSIFLDETDHLTKAAQLGLQEIWEVGHKKRGSKKSLLIGGRPKLFDYYTPMMCAGVRLLRNFLGTQELSRTYRLEMTRYSQETKPPHDFNVEGEVDVEALNAVYSLIHKWAEKEELNPRPPMPAGVITRYADNMRGLLSVADSCGEEWGQRARAALMALLEQEKAELPEVVILKHGLVIFDMPGLGNITGPVFDRELLRLDLPGVNWRRYRGPSGCDTARPITPAERGDLLRKSGIETRTIRPPGEEPYRGLLREWFVQALREREPESEPAGPRLRLITPQVE
jgi:hypothetical protein